MKVVIGTNFFGDGLAANLQASFPEVEFATAYEPETQIREIADADAFLGWPGREAIAAAENLRWIHVPGMGLDKLPKLAEVSSGKVVITNSPGPHTNPMADHAMAFILALAHNFTSLMDDQRAKRWDTSKYAGRMVELNGSVMGLLGLGGIGRAVAQRALAFGMEIYAVDPSSTDVPAGVRGVWGMDRLDELLRKSDRLVVTAPLLAELRGILDDRRIGLMKKGSYLIVVSHGGIVDERALVSALRSGHLAGAGLDTTETEPLPADSPLWDVENLILSPHTSALTPEMYEGRLLIFEANLHRFMEGRPLAFVCDLSRG